MAEAFMPRFGHGAFLLCLEDLYKKIASQELIYTRLIGKPSEVTYKHGEHVLQNQARLIYGEECEPLKHLYFIGDNVCTDIFGANLYHRYLTDDQGKNPRIDKLFEQDICQGGAEQCFSVLVETGVYSAANPDQSMAYNHVPRDFLPVENKLYEPTMIVPHVAEAVEAIFQQEQYT